MKSPVFIDTGYVLALVNTADQYHPQARAAALQVRPPFVTTEAVLIEVGNALAKIRWRPLGIATLEALRSDDNIEVVPVDATLFDRAVQLYASRMDKEWGLTDCISFMVMQERNIQQVLTTDRHFKQAKFQNILADT